MAKDKLSNLVTYQQELKYKLSSSQVSSKHKDHPETYKAFLDNELRIVNNKIQQLKNK